MPMYGGNRNIMVKYTNIQTKRQTDMKTEEPLTHGMAQFPGHVCILHDNLEGLFTIEILCLSQYLLKEECHS